MSQHLSLSPNPTLPPASVPLSQTNTPPLLPPPRQHLSLSPNPTLPPCVCPSLPPPRSVIVVNRDHSLVCSVVS
ncbi:4-O-methyl-glucuronoyl methylesterase 1-like [Microcaecilia unicolor]|uniref:4-O-methyl-glucuronoyl methylesterase 1-like n=1 Tax=Microcaecilia unicolor TaxID=1415580 RepID=A0A6P7Z4M2_9AMPH|nr:4-O-methyl-glucuronoyl methylesterase 1-like [Microcaecilia unicolor]